MLYMTLSTYPSNTYQTVNVYLTQVKKLALSKGIILISNRTQFNRCICSLLLLKSFINIKCVHLKNIILSVNLHIDHIFSGYICVN